LLEIKLKIADYEFKETDCFNKLIIKRDAKKIVLKFSTP